MTTVFVVDIRLSCRKLATDLRCANDSLRLLQIRDEYPSPPGAPRGHKLRPIAFRLHGDRCKLRITDNLRHSAGYETYEIRVVFPDVTSK